MDYFIGLTRAIQSEENGNPVGEGDEDEKGSLALEGNKRRGGEEGDGILKEATSVLGTIAAAMFIKRRELTAQPRTRRRSSRSRRYRRIRGEKSRKTAVKLSTQDFAVNFVAGVIHHRRYFEKLRPCSGCN